jgi:hypothetical protein
MYVAFVAMLEKCKIAMESVLVGTNLTSVVVPYLVEVCKPTVPVSVEAMPPLTPAESAVAEPVEMKQTLPKTALGDVTAKLS